jgi:hypothetical protein
MSEPEFDLCPDCHGDRLNPMEFPMSFLKLRDFNAGFTRFFQAIDAWLIVQVTSYIKNESNRAPLTECFRDRFFQGLNPYDQP